MNFSFGLLKPDCLKRGLEKKVLAKIEAAGLQIIALKRIKLTKKEVDIIWASCLAEDFYEDLLKFFTSADCLVFIVAGENAITRLNELVGYCEPKRAKKNTIRHQFGTSVMENVIHSSLNEEMFWKETALFFS
jgi:nucleoside-diphosphate kinase